MGNVVGFSCRGCFFVLLVLPGMKQCVAGLDELLCFGLVGRMPVPMDRTPTKTTCTTTCNTTSRTEQTEQQNSKEKVEEALVLCIARQPYRFTPSYVQFNAIRFRFHLTMVHVNAVLVVFFPFLLLFLVLLRLPW